MTRTQTTYYGADVADNNSTQFEWADAGSDPFSRKKDLMYLALAVERHDHRAGRGLAVGRIDPGAITAGALAANSVPTVAIQPLAVTNEKLADNAVTSAKILNNTILNEDLAAGVALANLLPLVPVNKLGDTEVGSLSFAANKAITIPQTGQINGAGQFISTRTGTAPNIHMVGTQSTATPIVAQNAAVGNGLGVLWGDGTQGWDFIVNSAASTFKMPVQATQFVSYVAHGTAPFVSSLSTTVCTNVNANFLQGYQAADFALVTHKVPQLLIAFIAVAANMAPGWVRWNALDGRILVGAGSAAGATPTKTFLENQQLGSSWNVGAGVHSHVITAHSHTMGNSLNRADLGAGSTNYALVRAAPYYDTNPFPISGDGTTQPNPDTGGSAWNFPTYAMIAVYKN